MSVVQHHSILNDLYPKRICIQKTSDMYSIHNPVYNPSSRYVQSENVPKHLRNIRVGIARVTLSNFEHYYGTCRRDRTESEYYIIKSAQNTDDFCLIIRKERGWIGEFVHSGKWKQIKSCCQYSALRCSIQPSSYLPFTHRARERERQKNDRWCKTISKPQERGPPP